MNSLEQLAAELEHQIKGEKDYLKRVMSLGASSAWTNSDDIEPYPVNERAPAERGLEITTRIVRIDTLTDVYRKVKYMLEAQND